MLHCCDLMCSVCDRISLRFALRRFDLVCFALIWADLLISPCSFFVSLCVAFVLFWLFVMSMCVSFFCVDVDFAILRCGLMRLGFAMLGFNVFCFVSIQCALCLSRCEWVRIALPLFGVDLCLFCVASLLILI